MRSKNVDGSGTAVANYEHEYPDVANILTLPDLPKLPNPQVGNFSLIDFAA